MSAKFDFNSVSFLNTDSVPLVQYRDVIAGICFTKATLRMAFIQSIQAVRVSLLSFVIRKLMVEAG